MDGLYWDIGRWIVLALHDDEEPPCVSIHTPESLASHYADQEHPGDVIAIRLADARQLAASILAAVHHREDELAKKRRRR